MKITGCPSSRNCRQDFLGEAHWLWRGNGWQETSIELSPWGRNPKVQPDSCVLRASTCSRNWKEKRAPSSTLKVQANHDDFTLWRVLHSWAWRSRRWDGAPAARRPCLLPVLHLMQGWAKWGTTNPAAQQQRSQRSLEHVPTLCTIIYTCCCWCTKANGALQESGRLREAQNLEVPPFPPSL